MLYLQLKCFLLVLESTALTRVKKWMLKILDDTNLDVTVITPHFNNLKGLERMLSSTVPMGVKVVVVDDQSNSTVRAGLKRLVENYSHVQLLYNRTPQKGAGVARNIGLNVCNTKWVLFADADDWFLEDTGEILRGNLRKNENADVIYFSPVSAFDGALKMGQKSQRHEIYEKLVKNYLDHGDEAIRYQYFSPCSKLLNVSFLKENNIQFDSCIAANDIMFSLKSGFLAKIVKAYDHNIYLITEGSHSLTKQKSKKVIKSRFLAAMRYNRYLKNTCKKECYQRELLGSIRLYSIEVKVISIAFLLRRFIGSKWRII